MGTYLNPGNILFREALNSEIYVDKTELIQYTNRFLNTENKLICVSRPRRFGKSMALQMLAAYYSKGCDSGDLFSGLKIGQNDIGKERFRQNLNQYDVLLIDMQGIISSVGYNPEVQRNVAELYQRLPQRDTLEYTMTKHPLLSAMQQRLIEDIRKNPEYAAFISEKENSLGNALSAIYENTGTQFILLIDEWDSIFRNYEEDTFLQDNYINLLRDLFKNMELLPVYAMVYMTGILPVKRYGTQSALNNFKEYTMLDAAPLEKFVGFTEAETMALYEEHGMDIEKAREWYDGYRMETVGHIYNPNSVVQSIERRKYKNYWTQTGTYLSVKKVIEMNFDGLKEDIIHLLGDGNSKVNVTKFQNDMVSFKSRDDVLTFLIHLGYLAYDEEKEEVYIPNKEIRIEFINAIEDSKWQHTIEAISQSEELLEATLAGDEKQVAECVEKIHEENTAILTYNNENDLSCVIILAYYQARDEYKMIREMPSGKGYADVVFLPRRGVEKPAIVVELKWDQSAQTALDQIRNKNYCDSLRDYDGKVLLVGINYDKKTKKHSCRIERIGE